MGAVECVLAEVREVECIMDYLKMFLCDDILVKGGWSGWVVCRIQAVKEERVLMKWAIVKG